MKRFAIIYFFFLMMIMTMHLKAQTAEHSIEIGCDDSLWNHVYHAYRLQVIEECKKVTGIVMKRVFEPDGDLHIQIRLDKGQELLLVNSNYERQKGCLVLEPICVSEVTQYSAIYDCKNFVNNVYLPHIGDHIEATGSYVIDAKHGWAEIHPVTKIVLLKD